MKTFLKTAKKLFGIVIVTFGVFVLTFGFSSDAIAQQGVRATAVAIIENGSVKEIKVTDAGRHYSWSPELSIMGGGGTGAVASAVCVPSGLVAGIDVVKGGNGYTSAPQIQIESPAETETRVKAQMKTADVELAIESKKASHQKIISNISKITWVAIPSAVIVALLLFLKKLTRNNSGKGKSRWLIIGGATTVCFVLTAVLGITISGNMFKSHPSSGHNGSSSSVTESDVVGRWLGEYEGLTAMDITLLPGGSFVASAGDFAGHKHSSGNWHISGHNTVVIDYGDGGQNLLFSYSNGQLVAGNGRALNRR